MITEYCDIDIARLIECVKKRPLLYDKSQTDYSNVVLRDQTWIEIAKEVTSTDLECKRKWNYLRGKFAREIKCDADSIIEIPAETIESTNWPFLKNMLFLKSHCKKRTKPQSKLDVENSRTINTLVEDPSLQQLAEIAFQIDGALSQTTEPTATSVLENVNVHMEKRDMLKNDYFNQSRLQYSSPTSSGLPMVTTIGTNTDEEVYIEQHQHPQCEEQQQNQQHHHHLNHNNQPEQHQQQQQHIEYEIPLNKKSKLSDEVQDAVQETVTNMLETFKNIVEQTSPTCNLNNVHEKTSSAAATNMLDHFAQFVASSLVDIPAKKRNDAIGHITNYLITIRNEENV